MPRGMIEMDRWQSRCRRARGWGAWRIDMRRSVVLGSLVCGLTFLLTGTASATPIAWAFTGTVTSVSGGNGPLDGSVIAGTPFAGTYTYDSAMVDNLPGNPTEGEFTSPVLPTSKMVVHVGSYSFVGPSNSILVFDSLKDSVDFASTSFVSNGFAISGMDIRLYDITGESLSSDSLPVSQFLPGSLPYRIFLMQYKYGSSYFSIQGQVDSFLLVPEPASAAMTLIAWGLFAARRRLSSHRR